VISDRAGLACIAASGARHMNEEPLQRLHRFSKLGTIDLHCDYLRPCLHGVSGGE
jgi:acyl-coenzyme A thioesterase PaaI-like protein